MVDKPLSARDWLAVAGYSALILGITALVLVLITPGPV
jgi:hypothetical protein